ncbi:hypothetical protein BASA81_015345 [Batrachochytrium salamandrivorans]|nr:hypothetical protein BASA81_015345 [Batrachochytrium salamandrivorans]
MESEPLHSDAAAAAGGRDGRDGLPYIQVDDCRPNDLPLLDRQHHPLDKQEQQQLLIKSGSLPPTIMAMVSPTNLMSPNLQSNNSIASPVPPPSPMSLKSSPKSLKSPPKTWSNWLWTLVKFFGPGYLVAVGYFDPGNWATDLSAGSQFGYRLLFIILLANLMAMVLQSLCVKLGMVTRLDLASQCRMHCPTWLNWILYIFCETAIVACDLAEVIGSAIALKLLFGLPLIAGVLITALDVLVILFGWNSKYIRIYEAAIALVVFSVGICFGFLIGKSNPVWENVFLGFLPSAGIFTEKGSIYNAVGIIGATVMPHNLYLHSALVRYRAGNDENQIGQVHEYHSDTDTVSVETDVRLITSSTSIETGVNMATIDTVIALAVAFVVNASILIVAAANFNTTGRTDIADIEDAHALIGQLLGPAAALIFAIGLLLSGQSSTITGTLAGQFVMEGFLGPHIKVAPWVRRIITRLLAIVPALVIVIVSGERSLNDLLVISQIILSLQLPFAIWPLIYFTCSNRIMTVSYHSPQDSDTMTDASHQSLGNYNRNGDELLEDDGVTRRFSSQHSLAEPPLNTPVVSTKIGAIKKSYANSWLLTIVGIIVAMVITVFNVILLVQILTGNSGN